AQCYKGHIE
ncbi:ABC transporter family protein, partial [Vibrio harveyi]